MSDTLTRICADKRDHIAAQKTKISEQSLLRTIDTVTKPRGFRAALTGSVERTGVGLIAEIKKASPSKGLIRADFDPAQLAKAYQAGGAACLSVLTDRPYFQGDDPFLAQARDATTLPVLRKDFMLDPYQVVEARAIGADCILLIMAALDDHVARDLSDAAQNLGMDMLVEVHDAEELNRALRLKAPLLGINNRNLKTLAVDLKTTEQLAQDLPKGTEVVCESGLGSGDDLARMCAIGVRRFLVGESLMRQQDVTLATQSLLSPVSTGSNQISSALS